MGNATGQCPTCGGEICSYDAWVCNKCGKRPDKPLLSYDSYNPPSDSTEDVIQDQSLKTMIAMERMANAITDHLTADKQPCENTATDVPDYGSLRAVCKTCKGVVAFSDYTRVHNSHHDTCTCSLITMCNLDVPPDVKVVFEAVYAKRSKVSAPIPGPMAPLDSDLKEIRETLDKHRKALAMLGTFAEFKDVGFFGTKPDRAVEGLIKLKACPDCVGTGWLARDESCRKCKMGYFEA